MINHISICFYHNINVKEKIFFFRARVEKGIARHIDASSVDSYQQGQITGSQIVVKYNISTFRYFNNHLSNYTKTIIRLRLVNIPLDFVLGIFNIFNNYSPKWGWLAEDIYPAVKRRDKYPTLATDKC